MTNNSLQVENGRVILFSKRISFMGYDEVDLHSGINWLSNPFNNRTWMWHLHQMSFIKPLLAYDISKSSLDGSKYALSLIHSWVKSFTFNLTDEFAWHDHATAIRGHNLVELVIYLENSSYLYDEIEFLKDILVVHAKQLYQDSFYSKATNHGLDQSMALFELAHNLLSINDSSLWLSTAIDRINFEISHAFSADGGHVENSPAYLNYGLKQVQEAIELGRKYEGDSSKIFFPEEILNKSLIALGFITQPNGKLPLIGDTKEFLVKDFFGPVYNLAYQNFLYAIRGGKNGIIPLSKDLVLPESGWAIFRSSWEQDKFNDSLHLVFKCGFLSNYHRHDDDLTFTLFAHGEEWLTDGGEYKHDPKDPYRIYFRSADSHNISMPYGLRAHRSLDDIKSTGIQQYQVDQDDSFVSAETEMFKGFHSSRSLLYSRSTNSITVNDTCRAISGESVKRITGRVDKSWVTYVTRFMIPKDKRIVVDKANNLVRVIGKKKTLLININNFDGNISVVIGQSEPSVRGWISREVGVLEKAYSVELRHITKDLDFEYSLSWEDVEQDKILLDMKIENRLLNVSTVLQNQSKLQGKLQYAYYLLYNKEKIDEITYQYENKASFNINPSMNLGRVIVVSFVRDKFGNKVRSSSRLK